MGLGAIRNRRCRSRNVRTRSMVDRCSPFRVEAHRSSSSQKVVLTLLKRLPQTTEFLASKEGGTCTPGSLRFGSMWGCAQIELDTQWLRQCDKRCDGREALMWKITTRGFTLQEVLIMAAMNVTSALMGTAKSERAIGNSCAHRDSRGSRRLSWQK